jgi:hypothetical protein
MLTKRFVMLSVAGSLVIFGAWLYLRPALRSEASIRAWLLSQTPLGSDLEGVRARAQSRGWIGPDVRFDSYIGFSTGEGLETKAFSGRLWRDPFPYRTTVDATWEFDRSKHLVSVRVSRAE